LRGRAGGKVNIRIGVKAWFPAANDHPVVLSRLLVGEGGSDFLWGGRGAGHKVELDSYHGCKGSLSGVKGERRGKSYSAHRGVETKNLWDGIEISECASRTWREWQTLSKPHLATDHL
jgi:hypothetical protein